MQQTSLILPASFSPRGRERRRCFHGGWITSFNNHTEMPEAVRNDKLISIFAPLRMALGAGSMDGRTASNWIKTQFFRDGLEGILEHGVKFATAVKTELGAKGGFEGDGETDGDAGEGVPRGEGVRVGWDPSSRLLLRMRDGPRGMGHSILKFQRRNE